MTEPRTAFALEGLGGNNAYGAGFLAAAQAVQGRREEGAPARTTNGNGTRTLFERERAQRSILPELEFVSCTSGAIASTAAYLRGDDLGAAVKAQIEQVEEAAHLPNTPWAEPWREPVVTLLTGIPGVFGPWIQAFAEHLQEVSVGFFTPGSPWFAKVPRTVEEWADVWLPARAFVPERSRAFFEATAATFNDPAHGIGIACNSFDPSTGIEHLYVNAAGMERIREHHDRHADYGSEHGATVYEPITADGLAAALWLFYYGFAPGPDGEPRMIDGAYTRSIILDELTFADRIYAVKPINHRWIGPLPSNVFDVQDMQIKLWMGIAYREQFRLIQTVNELLGKQAIAPTVDGKPGKRYHQIDLVPVEIAVQRGFFSYFVEDWSVFEDAYEQSLDLLTSPISTRLKHQGMPQPR